MKKHEPNTDPSVIYTNVLLVNASTTRGHEQPKATFVTACGNFKTLLGVDAVYDLIGDESGPVRLTMRGRRVEAWEFISHNE